MYKKYAPFIVLALAALSLYYIVTHQRKGNVKEQIEIYSDKEKRDDEGFNRYPNQIIYTKHARCRMDCRHISEAEVKEVLENGTVNSGKIEQDERGKTYPLEFKTSTDKMIRIVVAPKKTDLVLVTVIDLDREWPCDCH